MYCVSVCVHTHTRVHVYVLIAVNSENQSDTSYNKTVPAFNIVKHETKNKENNNQ